MKFSAFDLGAALAARRAQHLYRQRLVVDAPLRTDAGAVAGAATGAEVVVDGRRYLNFCSNDYLGLASHPDVIAAAHRGLDQYGVGSGASHLVSGHSRAHHQLEEALAEFTGRPRALLFSTGWMANTGVLSALLEAGDSVYEDRLNHASLIDGGLASGARFRRYRHADVAQCEALLAKNSVRATALGDVSSVDALVDSAAAAAMNADAVSQPAHRPRRQMIVTDGVFSMDGDVAPLRELAACAQKHNAWLMVDDAHGFGVLGREGRGCVDAAQLGIDDVPVLVGTLGKAFGTFGAFVAGSDDLIETLVQQARSYIYTTAMPPAVAVASLTSLELLRRDEWRREKLRTHITTFRAAAAQLGYRLMASETPIQPVLVGSSADALAFSAALRDAGVLVTAIRPPTVPEGAARLRITISAAHDEAQVQLLLNVLEKLAPQFALNNSVDGAPESPA